ncbi:MAG TPA: ABC transporter ATP-binding protein [Thermoflexia bacterium]|nr:ABC transporter ATP-binding protein [Thermoflexia bacterium]
MITLQGLTKRFDALTAVDQVDLTVPAGEIMALLGPNGAGKTTTVRMLAAILKPTAGSAQVAGYDVVQDARRVRRNVGMLTESPGLYERMSGREYLNFFGELWELPALARQRRIDYLAERFEMRSALQRRLGQYSKGMMQKVTLMRTLLHEPPVLLLDEPTSAMDPSSARLVRDMILQLKSEQRAIIVCTHNLPEAEELADRIAIIRQGKIVERGSLAELKQRLLGQPVMEARFVQPSTDGVRALVAEFAEVLAYGDAWIRYATREPEQVNPVLLQAFVRADIPVLALREVPRSLESVYLRVVGKAVAAE